MNISMQQGCFVGVFTSSVVMCEILMVVITFFCPFVSSTFLGCNSLPLILMNSCSYKATLVAHNTHTSSAACLIICFAPSLHTVKIHCILMLGCGACPLIFFNIKFFRCSKMIVITLTASNSLPLAALSVTSFVKFYICTTPRVYSRNNKFVNIYVL